MLQFLIAMCVLLASTATAWAQRSSETLPKRPSAAKSTRVVNVDLDEHRFDLGLLLSLPESFGLELNWQPFRWGSVWAYYTLPTELRVNVIVPGKRLVEEQGFAIRSPELTLPFDVDFGPHGGAGLAVNPFGGSFFLSFGGVERRVTIASQVESRLELVDPNGRALTNTVFRAQAASETQQFLLRATLGQRWRVAHNRVHVGWFLGATQPLRAQSNVSADVQVVNPFASDPTQVIASNLQEAEEQQEQLLIEKARSEVEAFERMLLPVAGLSIGLSF